MNKLMKNNSGVTLAALMITVIVMIIIAAISVYEGQELISKSRLDTLQTNMLTIQAKSKAYAEEIEAKVWAIESENNKEAKRTEEFLARGLSRQSPPKDYEYRVHDQGLVQMGLDELQEENENGNYIVIFSEDYKTIDVEFEPGIKYKGARYYKLSQLQKLLGEEDLEDEEDNEEVEGE